MTATTVEPKIADGVLELVRQHDCERELWGQLELVRECFPQALATQVRLRRDPDEDDRVWVVLSVRLARSEPFEQIQACRLRYVEQRQNGFPFRFHPAFVLSVDFAEDTE